MNDNESDRLTLEQFSAHTSRIHVYFQESVRSTILTQ